MTAEPRRTATELLEAVYDGLLERTDPASVPLSRVAVGTHRLLVAADDDRLAGLAHQPSADPAAVAVPDGLDAVEVASWTFDPPASATGEPLWQRALGTAALNALSDPHVDWRRGDPMARLSADVEAVATVGLFGPALDRFDRVDLRVVEREPVVAAALDVPAGTSVRTYLPDEAGEAFAGADVVFVTGSAFVYGGAGRYVALADEATAVVVIGATSSFLPAPLFRAGVDVVAGSRVTDAAVAVDAIHGTGCGTGTSGECVEKVYVSAEPSVDGLRLEDA